MKWFKHESNASQDAKLKKLRRRHGMAAIGLYWYILERIMTECEPGNTSLALEDDAETLALDCDMNESDIIQITTHMVELNLLQVGPDNLLVCHQLAKRFDKSQCNHSMRDFVDALRLEHGQETAIKPKVMTNPDPVMTGSRQIREEEIRTDNIRADESSSDELKTDHISRDSPATMTVVDNSTGIDFSCNFRCQSGHWQLPGSIAKQLSSQFPEQWLLEQFDRLADYSKIGKFTHLPAHQMTDRITGLLNGWWESDNSRSLAQPSEGLRKASI